MRPPEADVTRVLNSNLPGVAPMVDKNKVSIGIQPVTTIAHQNAPLAIQKTSRSKFETWIDTGSQAIPFASRGNKENAGSKRIALNRTLTSVPNARTSKPRAKKRTHT
jgi:hypothetical protein